MQESLTDDREAKRQIAIAEAVRLVASGVTYRKAAQQTGIPRSTIQREAARFADLVEAGQLVPAGVHSAILEALRLEMPTPPAPVPREKIEAPDWLEPARILRYALTQKLAQALTSTTMSAKDTAIVLGILADKIYQAEHGSGSVVNVHVGDNLQQNHFQIDKTTLVEAVLALREAGIEFPEAGHNGQSPV